MNASAHDVSPAAPRANNPAQVVEALRKAAAASPAFNAVMHLFALRERGRQQVNLAYLRLNLAQQGFAFKRDDVAEVLRTLARLGIGKLVMEKDKGVSALIDIRVTLQSVGGVALGTQMALERLQSKTPLVKLADQLKAKAVPKPIPQPKAQVEAPKAAPIATQNQGALISFMVNGQPLSLSFPKELTTDQLKTIISALYSK